jgi:hypothetical protein
MTFIEFVCTEKEVSLIPLQQTIDLEVKADTTQFPNISGIFLFSCVQKIL